MKRLPFIAIALHTTLVLGVAVVVGLGRGESVMLWNIFMAIDFPLSIIGGQLAEGLVSAFFQDEKLKFTVGYAIIFSVLGGVQYYFLTRWLCAWISHRRQKH